jgi:pimeloyl-ACP methyl ester carboxylesterase
VGDRVLHCEKSRASGRRATYLVLHGEHDVVPVELFARIAAAVPGAHFSVLPDCGHFTYLEAPERVGDAVAALCGAA